MVPAGHICEVLGGRSAARLARVAGAGPPAPCLRQVRGQRALQQLDYVLADVGKEFECVSAKTKWLANQKKKERKKNKEKFNSRFRPFFLSGL